MPAVPATARAARSCATLSSAYVRDASGGSVRYLMTRSRAMAFQRTLAAGSNSGWFGGAVLSEQAATVEMRVTTSGAGVRRDRTEQRCSMRQRPCDEESGGPYRGDTGDRKPRGGVGGTLVAKCRVWLASGQRSQIVMLAEQGPFLPRSDIARPHDRNASRQPVIPLVTRRGRKTEHVHTHERPRRGLDRSPGPRRPPRRA